MKPLLRFLCVLHFDFEDHPGWLAQHSLCKGNVLFLLNSDDLCIINEGMCDCMSRSVCASDRNDESLGCCVLSPFFYQALVLLSILRSLCICLEVLSDILPVIILARTLSHHNLFPLTSCLRVFFRVCRCFDRQGYCSRG